MTLRYTYKNASIRRFACIKSLLSNSVYIFVCLFIWVRVVKLTDGRLWRSIFTGACLLAFFSRNNKGDADGIVPRFGWAIYKLNKKPNLNLCTLTRFSIVWPFTREDRNFRQILERWSCAKGNNNIFDSFATFSLSNLDLTLISVYEVI